MKKKNKNIPNGWMDVKFSDFVEINPKRQLIRGEFYPFIEMRNLSPEFLHVEKIQKKQYTGGGSKFQNYDTLFARITPCLENGKISFVDELNENEQGFGSTEFIILCGKEKISDSLFIHYLCKSEHVTKTAISNMVGSSGRQRVPNDTFENMIIYVPKNISEQKKIAGLLYCLDIQIENLTKQNKIIEQTSSAIFRIWFADFLEQKKIIDSSIVNLGNYVNCVPGRSYRSIDLQESNNALVSLKCFKRDGGFSESGLKSYTGDFKSEQVILDDDIVVSQTDITQDGDVIGKPIIIFNLNYEKLIASLDCMIVRLRNNTLTKPFLYFLLKDQSFHHHALAYSLGTTVLHLDKKCIPEFRFSLPPTELIKKFDMIAAITLKIINANNLKISKLYKLKEKFFPKLISGEIRV